MLDPNIDETQPIKPDSIPENSNSDASPSVPEIVEPGPDSIEQTAPAAVLVLPRKPRRWPILLGGILLILALGALGVYLGYKAALAQRAVAYSSQVTKIATEQFMLAQQEQAAGQYDLAIRRYEYIIQLDSNFPGVRDGLAKAMLASVLQKTPTLTPVVIVPTPTIALTPTPDVRGEDDIIGNARALLANKEWVKALEVLDTLRNKNIKYKPVEVDGLYYVALRNRGMLEINQGRLESGLYDLALTERFAPLDVDANGLRTWARMYLTGASYWGARWDKVVEVFAQIYPYYPNLHDILGVSAVERFRKGSVAYGDQFAAAENYCDAYKQYHNAQGVLNDPAVLVKMNNAFKICYPPTATPAPTSTVTPTATKGAVLPTATVAAVQPTATTAAAATNTPKPPAETATTAPPTSAPPAETATTAPPAATPTTAPPTETPTTKP